MPPRSFRPPPAVRSAVVRLDVRPSPAVAVRDPAAFFDLVRAGFSAPRKQLRNSLSHGLDEHPALVAQLLAELELDGSRRAETLTLDEWASIYRRWEETGKVGITAYAKLNLSLEVLGKRSDGYHEVRTVMQTVDLADKTGSAAADSLIVRCNDTSLEGEDNLVWKAATALAKHGNAVPKAEIFLEKHIPVAMGLGGGSSDAAGAITSLNRLWGLGLPANELALVAAEVGSDVAFFLSGGTALAHGRGEQISSAAPLPGTMVTLVCPNMEITDKTARLYSRLTPSHFSDASRTDRMVENLKAGKFVSDMQHNVFEEVAFDAFPGLAGLRDRLIAATGKPPHLSGAGPALYFLPSSKDEYQMVSEALQPGEARVYLVQTVGCGHLTLAPGGVDVF